MRLEKRFFLYVVEDLDPCIYFSIEEFLETRYFLSLPLSLCFLQSSILTKYKKVMMTGLKRSWILEGLFVCLFEKHKISARYSRLGCSLYICENDRMEAKCKYCCSSMKTSGQPSM